MEPTQYLAAIRKRWWVIGLVGLLAGAAGYVNVSAEPDQYRATSKVFVYLARGDTVTELVQGSAYTQNLVESYVGLATEPVVLQPVIDQLGLDTTPRDLASSVSASAALDTFIIEITAVSTVPESAQAIANAVVEQLRAAVGTLSPRSDDGSQTVLLSTIAEAQLPEQPFAPSVRRTTAVALAAGLLLGLMIALGREAIDTHVRTTSDLQKFTRESVLGTVRAESRRRRDKIVMRVDPRSPGAEAYRRLRTNLQFLGVDGRLRSIVVTSAVPGEGKSTTAINLAMAMAEGPGRVLLIDADLRRPSVAAYTGLEGGAGLTTVLIGKAEAAAVIQPWGSPNLDVITSGKIPPNPSQLLASPAMAKLLAELKQKYELIILDLAPLLPVADPAIVTRLTDGAIIVVGAGKVRRHQVSDALKIMETSGASCLGLILNRTETTASEAYTHEYRERAMRRGRFGRSRSADRLETPLDDAPSPRAAGSTSPGREEPPSTAYDSATRRQRTSPSQ